MVKEENAEFLASNSEKESSPCCLGFISVAVDAGGGFITAVVDAADFTSGGLGADVACEARKSVNGVRVRVGYL